MRPVLELLWKLLQDVAVCIRFCGCRGIRSWTDKSKRFLWALLSGLTCTGGDSSHFRVDFCTVVGAPCGISCCLHLGHRCSSARWQDSVQTVKPTALTPTPHPLFQLYLCGMSHTLWFSHCAMNCLFRKSLRCVILFYDTCLLNCGRDMNKTVLSWQWQQWMKYSWLETNFANKNCIENATYE